MNIKCWIKTKKNPLSFYRACCALVISLYFSSVWAGEKSVVYLNSYHSGYSWSDLEYRAFKTQLADDAVNIYPFHMNTKHIKKPAKMALMIKKALAYIQKHDPDVIVAADDNASKMIIEPYFKNHKTPVVHLGVNLDAGVYGYPYTNSTGMVELEGLGNLIHVIAKYSDYSKVVMVFINTTTGLKKYNHYTQHIANFKGVVVSNFNEFKSAVLSIKQDEYILALDTLEGMKNYNAQKIKSFLTTEVKSPIISVSNDTQKFAHFGYIKEPDEFGIWAGKAVEDILMGKPVSDIPSVVNRRFSVFINPNFAKQTGVTVPEVFYDLPYIRVDQ